MKRKQAHGDAHTRITIYQKPTCTTCRKAMMILKESGVDFDVINYYTDPIPRKKLKELLAKMNLRPKDILRSKEPIYKELRLSGRDLPDEELIGLMSTHPDLIQRPIVERGNKVILARPAEALREIL